MDIFNWVMFSIVGLWLLVASCFDIKNREVPDWLNFSLIFIGGFSRLIYSIISSDFWILLYGLFGFLIALVLGIIMSYTRQWGDGDSKMIVGIGTCLGFSFSFSFLDFSTWPMFMYFLLNSLIAGAFYGLLWSFGLGIIRYKDFLKELHKWPRSYLILPLVFGIVLSLFSLMFNGVFRTLFLLMIVSLVICIYVLILVKIVEGACMYKQVKVNELVPGDWVVETVSVRGKIICSKKDRCLDEEQIKLLKKYKIQSVLVKEGIPFVPAFFLGFIISVIWGNLLSLLMI